MALAMLHPQRVERLLVLDIAPVAYDVSEPQWAAVDSTVRAMGAVKLALVKGKRDADQQLQRAVPDPAVRAFVLTNLVRSAGGASFLWRVNLPAVADAMPALGGWDVSSDAVYGGNCLFVAGGKSRFLRSTHLPAIQEHFSRFSLQTIRSADHWIHADEPDALLVIATNFLKAKSAP